MIGVMHHRRCIIIAFIQHENVDQGRRIGGEVSVRRFDVESADGILQLNRTVRCKIVQKIGILVKEGVDEKRLTIVGEGRKVRCEKREVK